MASFHKLKAGQVYYTVTKGRLGNTTLRTVSIHEVKVLEVHISYCMASWNHNKPERFYPGNVAHWKVERPVTVKGIWGSQRLARKDEKAKILAEQQSAALGESKESK